MKVLSLFDGISCGMVALERAGIDVDRYVAYEIDKHAITVSKNNYPQIEQCGDVMDADFTQYKGFDLLIGGSPCTHWSIANKNRETTATGLGFELFKQYVRALQESGCKYFLYENNNSISKEIKAEISKMLGVEPIMINSSLVSAQERKRCYWTNIPNVIQPQDKKIYLKDILCIETDAEPQDRIIMTKADFNVKVRKHYVDKVEMATFLKAKKAQSGKSTKEIAERCNVPLTKAEHWFRTDSSFSIPDAEVWESLKETINITETTYDKQVTEFEVKKNTYDMAKRIYNINGKHPTLTTLSGGHQRKTITDGKELFYLEPIHCERLQTLPDGYTEGVSDRQRFKGIGNGWTVDVIAHILSYIKKEREEKQMELKMNDYQLPEQIQFNYEELKKELSEKVSMYETMVYTDDQIQEAKKDKANLNKLKKALNDERIRQEKEYMKPFNVFKSQINEIIGIIDKPVAVIDKQVKEYEEKKKKEKLDEITNYFNSTTHPEWLHLSQIMDEKWMNASVSMKSVKESIESRLDQIEIDLTTLHDLPEFGFESTEVYKSTLDMNKAISEAKRMSEIAKAKAEKEEEQARIKADQDAAIEMMINDEESKKEEFAKHMHPPVEEVAVAKEETPAKQWVRFQALMTTEDALALRDFMISRNIEFKAVKKGKVNNNGSSKFIGKKQRKSEIRNHSIFNE